MRREAKTTVGLPTPSAAVPPPKGPPIATSDAQTTREHAVLDWFGVEPALLDEPSPDRPPLRPQRRVRHLLRAILGATALALMGAAVGVAAADTRFGWLGGMGAAARLTSGLAHSLKMGRFASWLGMVALFATLVLVCSAVLVGTIALLPIALESLLG